MPLPTEPVILVANSWQARKVRWVFWGLFLFFAGFAYWAWDLSQTYGLSPGDGGVLKPPGVRLTAAAIVGAIGLLPLLGMIAYVRRYVAGLVWQGERVVLSGACWPMGERSVPLAAFAPGREHDGRLYTVKHWIEAPWLTLSVGGRTYIVDLQAEEVNREGLARLFKEANRLGNGAR
ncbi:hypothetical protein [Enterovirga sp.]|uniref:hypothetical protein n=1 Tax=Enterovirga sp. TaxID=2026350 RepID=UPI002D16A3D5|nr:hypothetical protein [Enterovirga sp.]HMO28686.1 hypothetical protein [Enterovirga sp.]